MRKIRFCGSSCRNFTLPPRKSTGIHPSSAMSDSHVSIAAKSKVVAGVSFRLYFMCAPPFTEKCSFFQYSKGEKRMSTRHEYCKKVLRIAKKKEYPLSERYSFRRLFFLALLADAIKNELFTFHCKIQIRHKLSCNLCQCVHVQIIHSAADTANRMRMTPHHSIITGA